MQRLNIHQLSDSGILESEAEPLDKISRSLPPQWLAYSNFEFRAKSFGNREVDLVLVTQDNIILVELKNWNGDLRSDGNLWILNGRNRGKSPVVVTNDKAKKLKTLLQEREGHNLTGSVYVEPIVVLCGSAGPQNLSDEDRQFTITLDEFCEIGGKGKFQKCFPSSRSRKSSLCKEKEIFNRFFSLRLFNARQYRYDEYIPIGKPNFRHKDGLYEEYIAEHEFARGNRALLRTWNLSALPAIYSTESQWRSITRRENEVIGYLKAHLPAEAIRNSLFSRIGGTPESELSRANFELFELPSHCDLLESYIVRSAKRLSINDRIELSKKLLGLFGQLHEANVAHRDISETSIWTGHDLNIAASRWLASAFPEGKTVGRVREFLHSGRSVAPEDQLDVSSDPYKRDVFLLGRVIFFIISGRHLPISDGVAEYEPLKHDLENADKAHSELLEKLGLVLERSLDWDPSIRYSNAIEMSEAFQEVAVTNTATPDLFRKKIDPFKKDLIPYLVFPIKTEVQSTPVHVYESDVQGRNALVKVWPSLQPSDTNDTHNLRLLNFLASCSDLQRTKHPATQTILDFGVSQIGVYLVVEKCPGVNLSEFLSSSSLEPIDRTRLAIDLISATRSIHKAELFHGDIKPENIFVEEREDNGVNLRFIDLPDIDAGGAAKISAEYANQTHSSLSPGDQDRYACLVTITEILAGRLECVAGTRTVEFESIAYEALEEEINQRFREEVPIRSLDPVLGLLKQIEKELRAPELSRFTIPIRRLDARTPLVPDGDYYPLSLREMPEKDVQRLSMDFESGRFFEILIFGLEKTLQLVWDARVSKVHTGRIREGLPAFLRKKAYKEIRAFIVFEPGSFSDFTSIEGFLQDTVEEDVRTIAERSKDRPAADRKEVTRQSAPPEPDAEFLEDPNQPGRPDVREIWRSFIEAEANVLPEVEVVDDPEFIDRRSRILLFPYERTNGYPIEFDSAEDVIVQLVRTGKNPVSIGKLIHTGLTDESMSIELSRNIRLAVGDTLRLEGLLAKSSYDRRRQAVERMISGESAHPKLMDWIAGSEVNPDTTYNPIKDWHERLPSELPLNDAQLLSIKTALNVSPISLVQGPPGTGKTLYIAALIYLLKRSGDGNILLTSQSHEAVNNCIEKLISVYEDDIDSLDVVRVGSLSMCSESVARYHIDNIQHRYRRQFETDIRYRIENSAKALGLPEQFTSQYTRLALSFRPLIEQFQLIVLEESAEMQNRYHSALSGILESAKGRSRRVSQRLHWPDSENLMEILQNLKGQLTEIHQISNQDAVERLGNLIDIAFEWRDALSSPHGNFGEFLTRTKRVVAGTCVGIGRKNLNIMGQRFGWVIIDEAARCTSGELAVPSVVGERLVLVGDHQQLPPLYPQEVLSQAMKSLGHINKEDMNMSDFRRIIEGKYGERASQILTKQYRMNPSIGSMVSQVFYKGRLETVDTDTFLDEEELPGILNSEVMWLDTSSLNLSSREQREVDGAGRETKSFINKGEIKEIIELLREFSDSDELVARLRRFYLVHGEPIGVICAYAGQKRELIRAFRQKPFSDEFRDFVKIDTVDSYQGKENLIIIQSLVRNNKEKIGGFLSSSERINVAISRAMERLFIVGAAEMWSDQDVALGEVYRFIAQRAEVDNRYLVVDVAEKWW